MQYILSLFTSFVSIFDTTVTLVEYVAPFPEQQQEWSVEYNIDPEIWCLAENIYHESKGEPIEGKISVAKATLNRVKSPNFPNTVCEVVYQPSNNPNRPLACAFSWTCAKIKPEIINFEKWDESAEIGAFMYYDLIKSDIQAKHYVRCGIRRLWMIEMYQSKKVHNHCFYRKRSRS